jgi:hypothetical protein
MVGLNPSAGIVELTNGPSGVRLQVDSGETGPRGSYVIANSGSPDYVFSSSNPLAVEGEPGVYGINFFGSSVILFPQPLDWYINLKTDDEDYKVIYQLDETNTWTQIFKLVPNVFDANIVTEFSLGTANIEAEVSSTTLPLTQKFGDMDIPEEAVSVNSESEMLSSDIEVNQYVWRTDRAQFYKLLRTPASSAKSWMPQLSVNLQIDIESYWVEGSSSYNEITQPPYPTATSFVTGKPFATISGAQKTYIFPVSINAAHLNKSAGAWLPLEDLRTVHLTISVI